MLVYRRFRKNFLWKRFTHLALIGHQIRKCPPRLHWRQQNRIRTDRETLIVADGEVFS